MHRSLFILLGSASLLALTPDSVFGQASSAHAMLRGPGGYLAWYKLAMVAGVFLLWVGTTDWINRDTLRFGADTRMPPETWNPIVVGSFLVGFLVVLSLPMFLVGFPLYLIAAFTPLIVYLLIRRARVNDNPILKSKLRTKPGQQPAHETLPQDLGADIKFKPDGTAEQQQTRLIRSRQAPAYQDFKDLIHYSVTRRAELALIDYTRDRVAAQIQVDGAWHTLPPVTRDLGDAILTSMKYMAGLDPQDRRSQQNGQFAAVIDGETELRVEVTTQGVQTGERVQLKFARKVTQDLTLAQLGMWPDMVRRFTAILNAPGLVIVSAPPGGGLTSTWRATMEAADRVTRDCIGVVDTNENETEIENVLVHRFDAKSGQSPAAIMKTLLLAQPDFLAVPNLVNSRSLDLLSEQAVEQNRTVVTRAQANFAADALVRVLSLSQNKPQFAKAVTAAIGQRLVRRLCDQCKQPIQVQPKLIQQLGGDPNQQNTLFNQWKLPPPDQQVDEKGRPIEFEPCEVCSGLGYIGRVAAFEMIVINDRIRGLLTKQPKVEQIQQLARETGSESLVAQAYKLVLLGITSLSEVQRVMKA